MYIYLFICVISVTNLAKTTRALRAKRVTRIRPRRGRNSSSKKLAVLLYQNAFAECILGPVAANCHVKRICITRGEQREEMGHYSPSHGRLARVLSLWAGILSSFQGLSLLATV